MSNIKAVKFGGSSLCDAQAIERAAKIVLSDETRRYITVSAPGKRRFGVSRAKIAGLERLSSAIFGASARSVSI